MFYSFKCEICSAAFSAEKKNRRFCSRKCAAKIRTVDRKCLICENIVKSTGTKRKFCSRECYFVYQKTDLSQAFAQRMSVVSSGNNNSMSYKSIMARRNCSLTQAKEIRKTISGTLGFSYSDESKRKMSLKKINLSNKVYGRGKAGFFTTKNNEKIWMRSSWERKFAKFLDAANLIWEYEPKCFDLVERVYHPDFYVHDWKCFVEIKGYMDDYSKWKILKFKELYPNETLLVLQREQLENEYKIDLKTKESQPLSTLSS